MDARLGTAAEGDDGVHEIRVLGRPLEALACAHGPARYAPEMGDVELLGEEGMLGADVVVEGHIWERGDGGVGWRDRLAVAEEGGDDDEVFLWVQGLVFADEPLVVSDRAGVPGWVEDCGRFGVAVGLVRDPGTWKAGAALELEVAEVVGGDAGHEVFDAFDDFGHCRRGRKCQCSHRLQGFEDCWQWEEWAE